MTCFILFNFREQELSFRCGYPLRSLPNLKNSLKDTQSIWLLGPFLIILIALICLSGNVVALVSDSCRNSAVSHITKIYHSLCIPYFADICP